MPKDDEDEGKDGKLKHKRVTFADDDIHHELDDEELDDEEEEDKHTRPIRHRVPSYVIGRPLADYDATEGSVSIDQKHLQLWSSYCNQH